MIKAIPTDYSGSGVVTMESEPCSELSNPFVKGTITNPPSMECTLHSSVRQCFGTTTSDHAFFQKLHSELHQSIVFYDNALIEFSIREERVCYGASLAGRSSTAHRNNRWILLARGVYQLYKDALLLESYAILTFCAFSKILKKYDKLTSRNIRQQFMETWVETASFADTSELQAMIHRCEHLYNEASKNLVAAARNTLNEDELLFIDTVTKIGSEVIIPTLPQENRNSVQLILYEQQQYNVEAFCKVATAPRMDDANR